MGTVPERVGERFTLRIADIDLSDAAGDRVEAGRQHDEVELVLDTIGCDDALGGHTVNRVVSQVDQADVVLTVDLEVILLE